MKRSWRISLFLMLGVMAFVLLSLRLVDLQILRGSNFLVLADSNRLIEWNLPADRGVILDRYGEPLVKNKQQYYFSANPSNKYSPLTPISREDALQRMATQSAQVVTKSQREYLFPDLSHLIGYVGQVTADDLKNRSYLRINDVVGKMGLEQIFDQQLRGTDGERILEVSADLKESQVIKQQDSQSGQNIETTIDPYLSEVAAQALGENKGTVIVSNAQNGEILAMVSKPGFDSNLLLPNDDAQLEQERRSQVAAIFADENKLMFNRAVSGAYPPGSIFKLVTALAALESEAVDAETTVLDEGVLKVDDFEYRSWYYWSYGRTEGELDLIKALKRSNDIYFYKAAEWTGVDRLAEMARQLGLGERTGFILGPEANGLVPDPAWKEEVIGERWYLGNTYHMGIGQGDVLTSPLQIAQLVQGLAHHGEMCQPHIIPISSTAMGSPGNQAQCMGMGLKEKNLDLVLEGMIEACNPEGTAFPFFERNGALYNQANTPAQNLAKGVVACKTGTAEFGGVDENGYRPTHGWWVGIVKPQFEIPNLEETTDEETEASQSGSVSVEAEENNLRAKWLADVAEEGFPDTISMVVLIESDEADTSKEGSYDAAPVGKEILDWIEGNL